MNKLLQLILLLPLLAQADMRGPSDEAKQRADERLAAREQQLDAELARHAIQATIWITLIL